MDWNDILKGENRGNGKDEPPIQLPNLKIPDFKAPVIIMLLIFAAVWLFSCTYVVKTNQKGVVLRFGKHHITTNPGFHFKLPYPIDNVIPVDVTDIRREEIGFRTVRTSARSTSPAKYRNVPKEALMLTGDENIVAIQMVVQYVIKSPENYWFNIKNKRKTIRDAAEAALREVIGSIKIDDVLTTEKDVIQIRIKILLQSLMNKYKSGFKIKSVNLQDVIYPKEVHAAFKDVASAREDKNRMINEAQGYRNSIIPETRGKVSQIINAAEAYREEKITIAKGDAERFSNILKEYNKAKNVTKRRMYIETMEEILPDINKIIMDNSSTSQTIPLLSLDRFINNGGRTK